MHRLQQILFGLIVPVLVLLLWQMAASQPDMAGIVPTPVAVMNGFAGWIWGQAGLGLNPYLGTWVANVTYSGSRVVQGFFWAAFLGIPLGLLIGWSKWVSKLLDPMIQSLRPIPITAWLPFSIALFGIRDVGSIFLIFLGGFYAVVVNTTQGARDVDKNLVRAAEMMGSRPSQLLWRVVLPSAMPAIFTGLRVGLGISWTAVIVSEMVAVKSGLGYVLWDAYYVGRMDIVLADMVSIGAMGFISDRLIVAVESRVLRWRMLQNY
jgi:NitT/TauT family transport system permease protein